MDTSPRSPRLDEITSAENEALVDNHTTSSSSTSGSTINSQLPIYLSRQRSSRRKAQGRVPSRMVKRLIRKSGKSSIIRGDIPDRRLRYIRDFANTIVNSRWRWCFLFLSLSFVLSWLLFATLYLIVAHSNGDIDSVKPAEEPCLTGIQGFAGYFSFSVETQHSIGYGSRSANHYCPEVPLLIAFQVILGYGLCSSMVSIIFLKMVRPFKMHATRLFSKNAVICQRDGTLCFMFRVRDEEHRYGVGTSISAYLVQSRVEEPFLKSFVLEPSGLLLWPLEIVHKINQSSPFWDLSAKDLVTRRFEVIVTMQGTSVTTGQSTKSRASYLSTEILWGHRFRPCVNFDEQKRRYVVDHKEFHKTEEVLTPLCSAQRLIEVVDDLQPRSAPVVLNFPGYFEWAHESPNRSREEPNEPFSPNGDNFTTAHVISKLSRIDEVTITDDDDSDEELEAVAIRSRENDSGILDNRSVSSIDLTVRSDSGKNTSDSQRETDSYKSNEDECTQISLEVESLIKNFEDYLNENTRNDKPKSFDETKF